MSCADTTSRGATRPHSGQRCTRTARVLRASQPHRQCRLAPAGLASTTRRPASAALTVSLCRKERPLERHTGQDAYPLHRAPEPPHVGNQPGRSEGPRAFHWPIGQGEPSGPIEGRRFGKKVSWRGRHSPLEHFRIKWVYHPGLSPSPQPSPTRGEGANPLEWEG